MVAVSAYFFKLDIVALFDSLSDFQHSLPGVVVQERLAVFDGKDDVVVRVVDTVVTSCDAHALQCI